MSMIVVKSVGAALVGSFLESKYSPEMAAGSHGLPKLFGITPGILTAMSFWVLMHGMTVVGASRSKLIKLAKADGEKDVEERYGLPNLYAQGTSKHARTFNCIQRSHQQIFETFPQMCLLSMVGAVHYPIMAATNTLVYAIGRYCMSNSYANADGDASKRYSHPLASLIWYGYLSSIVLGALSSASFVVGKPLL